MENTRRIRSPLGLLLVAAWGLALAGPPLALARWRQGRLAELTAPAVQADWDAFRADMRRESGRTGPVQRKVPKSAEPPELVWLRDFFPLAVTAWVVLAGVLGGFLVFLTLGAAGGGRNSLAEDEPPRDRHDQKQDHRDRENTDERKHGRPPKNGAGQGSDPERPSGGS